MRLGVIIIIGLFLGAFSAHFLLQDRGYVLIRFLGTSTEMSVPVLVMALVAAYVALRLIVKVLEAPRRIGDAIGARERAVAQGALTRGLAEISAGNLARGERILTRQASRGDAPVVAYLEAAKAAQRQGAHSRRDSWMRRAHDHAPGDAPAVLITQAELEIEDGEFDKALATLRRLEAIRPRHAQCIAMQARIHEARGEWQPLDELLPRLKRDNAVSSDELARLEGRVAGHAITMAAQNLDVTTLRRRWKQLGQRGQKDAALTRHYVGALIAAGDDAEAADVIKRSLRSAWHPELLYCVGRLNEDQQRKLQPQITAWRRKRAEDPALLYAAAAVGASNDPQKALARLESSLEQAPCLETYELYGRLLDGQGRHQEATAAFRSALSCTSDGRVSALARLEQQPVGAPETAADAVSAAAASAPAASAAKPTTSRSRRRTRKR